MRRLLPYVAAVAAVAITTALIGLVLGRVQIANISMLYLVAVLVVAVAFGRSAAIAASLLAFLTFDWFFVPPTHQLVVADAEELISLALFLITAVVTGTLAARERVGALGWCRSSRPACASVASSCCLGSAPRSSDRPANACSRSPQRSSD